MKRFMVNKYIVSDPRICHGKLTFAGTRIMVWQVLELLAGGESARAIIKSYPSLRPEHITAALQYASSITKEGNVVINPHAGVFA